ncbi:Hypothetical protein CINCED_3A003190 [Cinara cedri]|nr:Hypothetical protein CINCED_3A003190 [Cinara cedri]
MVFKAGQKLFKTRVSFLILLMACLVMPAVSNDLDLMREQCGFLLETNNAKENEIRTSTKFHDNKNNSLTKDSTITKRNNDIKILKRVRTQLKLARNHFRTNKELIANLYNVVKTGMKTEYDFEWLPSQTLYWYKTFIKNLDKDTKVFILLPVLRDSLQNFSLTLNQMRHFNEAHHTIIQSNNYYTTRKQILNKLYINLIPVWCEVKAALLDLSAFWDKELPESPRPAIVPRLNSNPDYTTMLVEEWGVLTTYYRFLKDWRRISRDMVHDQMDPWPVVPGAAASGRGSAGAAIPPIRRTSPVPCIRHRHRPSRSRRRKSSDSVT